jgi:signal transduction histidine kinase
LKVRSGRIRFLDITQQRLMAHKLGERVKELNAFYSISSIIEKEEQSEEKYRLLSLELEKRVEERTAEVRKIAANYHVLLDNSNDAIGNVVRDAGGSRVALYGVSRDITQQKRMVEDLERARTAAENANQAKSLFLANMSHEIRTPMNAILGFAQLVLSDATLPEKHRQHLQIINRSGHHLLSLINDILEMSKIEAGHITYNPGTFNLAHLL